MTGRREEELELLREVYPDLKAELFENQQWILIPEYQVPAGWHAQTSEGAGPPIERVEVCCKIPAQRDEVPYGFAVRPGFALPKGGAIDHYSYPFQTAWGSDFGHFSWQAEGGWQPADDVRIGDNMLGFVRSFRERLRSVA